MPRTPPWRNCRRKAGLQRYIGLRLFAFLGMSDSFWIGLQTDDDTARRNAGAHAALCAAADMKALLLKPLAFGVSNA